jgi:hypothetical protein
MTGSELFLRVITVILSVGVLLELTIFILDNLRGTDE